MLWSFKLKLNKKMCERGFSRSPFHLLSVCLSVETHCTKTCLQHFGMSWLELWGKNIPDDRAMLLDRCLWTIVNQHVIERMAWAQFVFRVWSESSNFIEKVWADWSFFHNFLWCLSLGLLWCSEEDDHSASDCIRQQHPITVTLRICLCLHFFRTATTWSCDCHKWIEWDQHCVPCWWIYGHLARREKTPRLWSLSTIRKICGHLQW